jgi:hypothetical protein
MHELAGVLVPAENQSSDVIGGYAYFAAVIAADSITIVVKLNIHLFGREPVNVSFKIRGDEFVSLQK